MEEKIKQVEPPCVVEAAVKPPKSGNMTNLPMRITERPDLLVFVTGAPSCIRGIYKMMRKQNKLAQFAYCLCDEADYAKGTWLDKYVSALNKELQRPGLGGIIIYSSCLDCLARVNINKIRARLDNPQNIPVELLLRGPVSSSTLTIKPKERLEIILADLPLTDGKLEEAPVLPPPLPDYVGIGNMTQTWNTYNLAMEIGGCSACISLPPEEIGDYKFRKTTFSGYAALKKWQEHLIPAIKESYAQEVDGNKSVVLATSALTANAGLAPEAVADALTADNIPSYYFPSNGFKTAEEGVSDALLTLTRKITAKPQPPAHKTVGVLGAANGIALPLAKINHALEHFGMDNYYGQLPTEAVLANPDLLAQVHMNWVCSAAGLAAAQDLEERFGIPYFAGLPIGKRHMFAWRNKFYGWLKELEKLLELPEVTPAERIEKVLTIGDPVVTAGIKCYLCNAGFPSITRAVYAPLASTRAFYEKVLGKVELKNTITPPLRKLPQFITDAAELVEQIKDYDVIIADALLIETIKKFTFTKKIYIAIEDGFYNKGLANIENPNYMIFGKKGAAWFDEQLNS